MVNSLIKILIILSYTGCLISASDTLKVTQNQLDKHPYYLFNLNVLETDIEAPANINLNDPAWQNYRLISKAEKCIYDITGTGFIHFVIDIQDSLEMDKEISLNLYNIGTANEIFWENELIANYGSFTETDSSSKETRYQLVKIPFNKLSKGTHNVFIRFFNNSVQPENKYVSIELGYDRSFIRRHIEHNYSMIFFFTVMFVGAVFFSILFFGFKNYSYLFMSIYSLGNAAKVYFLPIWAVQAVGLTITNEYDYLCDIFYTIAHIALIAFVISKFNLNRLNKFVNLSLLAPFSILLLGHSDSMIFTLAACYILISIAIIKKLPGRYFVLSAISSLAICTLLSNLYKIIEGFYFNDGYFWGVILLILIIAILTAKEIAMHLKLKREATLRSSRLENELLKRNIQPHFILNTLTALQEVVEQEPSKASKLIQALADEFRLFSKVAGEKLIPISDELKICDAHLKIMEYRKDAKFKLLSNNIAGTELVPPGIFHTIIENGTTHGYTSRVNGIFSLSKEIVEGCTIFTIFNDGDTENIEINKGTGLRYIESRLEESFPGNWKLDCGVVKKGWYVKIEFCKEIKF